MPDEALLDMPRLSAGLSVQHGLRAAHQMLAGGGVASPALDARLLLMLACDLTAEQVITGSASPLSAEEAARLEGYLHRRLAGEPVSRIRGWREFWGLRFEITKDTLDPRPDSERVVETALALTGRDASGLVLDLGTGSGCLLLSFLSERPGFRGIGADLSRQALATARRNARHQGLHSRAAFLCADWSFSVECGIAQVLICNPPYISSDEIGGLSRDVRNFDPNLALDGGGGGLDAYRRIVPDAARVLRAGGIAVFEVGLGQAGSVARLLADNGFQVLRGNTLPLHDLNGVERVVAARRQ